MPSGCLPESAAMTAGGVGASHRAIRRTAEHRECAASDVETIDVETGRKRRSECEEF